MPTAVRIVLNIAAQPIDAARRYSSAKLRADTIAGLTVAAVAIPQSMAYAEIVGVPVQYGIYTVIIQCLIGSLFNSQKYLSVGPIITQSLLVFATVASVVDPADPRFLSLVVLMTFIKGLMQLAMAALRLGGMVRYVSRSVIVGFTAGAGVLIAAKQIKNFLGVDTSAVHSPGEHWPGLVGIFSDLTPALHGAHWPSIAVGLGAMAVVLGARKLGRFVPGPLIAVVASGVVVALVGWTGGDLLLIEPLRRATPHVVWPPSGVGLAEVERLLGGAFALALLGLMETYSIGQMIASKTGQRINANQELIAQGVANFLSSFFQCFPGSGSFSRSALNYYAGARTLYAGVFNAIFVAVVFFALAPLAAYVPMAALAAILFVIAYSLIDWRMFLRMRRTNRADAAVCLATFAATLFIPLQYAVFVGIALNIALYLRRASRLHMSEMVQKRGGPPQERPITDRTGNRSVVFLSLEGDLFFGVADELHDQLARATGSGVRVVVIRMKRTHMIDSTVLGVMENFVNAMRERDGHVLLCGLTPDLHRRIADYGLAELIGEENIFESGLGVFASAKAALRRARKLVGHSIDTDALLLEEDDDDGESERGETTPDYSI